MNKLFKYSVVPVFCLIAGFSLYAQEDDGDDGGISNQNVIVNTEFTPEISDAFRMENLPEIHDTIKVEPEFEYKLFSKKLPTTYIPDPLSAAQLKSEQPELLNNGFARLAIGSKLMLDGEIHYNNTRSDDLNWGVSGVHSSGHGRLDNEAKDNVFAGYNKNKLDVFGKKMYSETTLKGSVGFRSDQHFFYGYQDNPALGLDSIPISRSEFQGMNQMQRYNMLSVRTFAKSHYNHSKKMNFKVGLDYDYWFDKENNSEHNLKFNLGFDKKIKKELVGIDAQLQLLPASFMDSSRMFIDVNPYLAHFTDNFKIKLGLHTRSRFAGDSSSYHFYPDVRIEQNIADVILPYFSFSGNLSPHTAAEITHANPFVYDIDALSPVKETNIKQNIVVGIKGRISEEVQFNFNGKYLKIDDEIFFVNDLSTELRNRFNIVYSDVELFKAYGELIFDFPNLFSLRLYGNYNHFSWIKDIDQPWHVPKLNTGLYAKVSIMPQLFVYSDASLLFGRYALDPTTLAAEKMKTAIDINIGAEYIVSQQLRAFVDLNNIASQNYEIWNNYPVYGFHAMAGISYSF